MWKHKMLAQIFIYSSKQLTNYLELDPTQKCHFVLFIIKPEIKVEI